VFVNPPPPPHSLVEPGLVPAWCRGQALGPAQEPRAPDKPPVPAT
jgi:hypothetical protein